MAARFFSWRKPTTTTDSRRDFGHPPMCKIRLAQNATQYSIVNITETEDKLDKLLLRWTVFGEWIIPLFRIAHPIVNIVSLCVFAFSPITSSAWEAWTLALERLIGLHIHESCCVPDLWAFFLAEKGKSDLRTGSNHWVSVILVTKLHTAFWTGRFVSSW